MRISKVDVKGVVLSWAVVISYVLVAVFVYLTVAESAQSLVCLAAGLFGFFVVPAIALLTVEHFVSKE